MITDSIKMKTKILTIKLKPPLQGVSFNCVQKVKLMVK